MNANPILLQRKFTRVIKAFAQIAELSLSEALDFFYNSELYPLVKEGVSDLHCMSDMYLAEELLDEYRKGN